MKKLIVLVLLFGLSLIFLTQKTYAYQVVIQSIPFDDGTLATVSRGDDTGVYWTIDSVLLSNYDTNDTNVILYFGNFDYEENMTYSISFQSNSSILYQKKYLYDLDNYNYVYFVLNGEDDLDRILLEYNCSYTGSSTCYVGSGAQDTYEGYVTETLIPNMYFFIGSENDFIKYQMSSSAVSYENGFRDGYDRGYDVGYDDAYRAGVVSQLQAIDQAYDDGYEDGIQSVFDYGFASEGLNPNLSYEFDVIYDNLFNNGFGDLDESSFSYTQGYSKGLVQSENDTASLIDFIPGILGVLIGFVLQLASFEFLGVSLLDILVAIVSVIGVLIIFKLFFGK